MDFVWLRFLLAASVMVAHFHAVMGDGRWTFNGLSSTVAVQAFFVISGWIVTASYRSSSNAGSFFVRRLARLYPLYAFVVAVQAIAVVLLVGVDLSRFSDVGREVGRYLTANLAFANFAKPSLLGFLDDAPVASINPSLWTLKIEVLFYLTVPLWVWIDRRWGWRGLGLLFVASTAFVYAVSPLSTELGKQLPGQLRFFIVGMACERMLVRRSLPTLSRGSSLAIALVALGLAQLFDEAFSVTILQPLFVGVFVLAAYAVLPLARGLPDISYGTYLVHAPLIQFGRALGLVAPTPMGFALVVVAVLMLSWVVSVLIEAPAIRLGRIVSDHVSAYHRRRTAMHHDPIVLDVAGRVP